jgi:hypothetical protein
LEIGSKDRERRFNVGERLACLRLEVTVERAVGFETSLPSGEDKIPGLDGLVVREALCPWEIGASGDGRVI